MTKTWRKLTNTSRNFDYKPSHKQVVSCLREEAVMDLTNEQWAVLDPLIGEMPRRADGRGRPWRGSREVLNGIPSILRTGAQWADLPDRYPPYQTCHRRYQRWVHEGTLERVLEALATDLKERGGLDLSECFIDGTFIVAKKGADAWVQPSGARVRSSWQWQTALVYLSPSVPPRLRLTRSVSSLPPSTRDSSQTSPDA
jgi:transposase